MFRRMIKHYVRFLSRPPGGMPEYETTLAFDKEVESRSFIELREKLHRPGKSLLNITQRDQDIENEAAYNRIKPNTKIWAHYRESDIPPLVFDGFQG
jgi:hypothetical protein